MGFRIPIPLPRLGKKNNSQSTLTLEKLAEEMRGATGTSSGQRVNWQTALKVTTVLACRRVIAEGIASMPRKVYRPLSNGGREQLVKHEVSRLLAKKPNGWQTPFEFIEGMTGAAVLTGNAVAIKTRALDGSIRELIPIVPHALTIRQLDNLNFEYDVRFRNGTQQTFAQKDIFHLRGPSDDFAIGSDIARLARETIGLAMANEEYQGRQAANGARSAGYLYIKPGGKQLTEEQVKSLREAWQSVMASAKVPVLEGDIGWESTGQTGQEAQILETRRFCIEDICRAFRVFPQMVGFTDKTSTYASAEQFFIAHVVHTEQPWMERWEDAVERDLMTDEDRDQGIYVKFSPMGLMRGAAADRAAFYKSARESAWMSVNEIRAFEDMDRIDDTAFDDPRMPLNTNPLPKGSEQNAPSAKAS